MDARDLATSRVRPSVRPRIERRPNYRDSERRGDWTEGNTWRDPAAIQRPQDSKEFVGTVMCLAKRQADEYPFALVVAGVTDVTGGIYHFQRPRVYMGGGNGVHFKLLPDTYRPINETHRTIGYVRVLADYERKNYA